MELPVKTSLRENRQMKTKVISSLRSVYSSTQQIKQKMSSENESPGIDRVVKVAASTRRTQRADLLTNHRTHL